MTDDAHLRYGPGIIHATPRGTYAAFVSTGHGTCRRRVLKTLAEAKSWILATATSAPASLTPAQTADAIAALSVLPPGTTLAEAARHWRDTHPAAREAITVAEAWERYSASVRKGATTLRPRTLQAYRAAWNAIAAADGPQTPVHALDAARIDKTIGDSSPARRNGLLRSLSAVFGWLVAEGLAASNPCASMRRARIPQGVPVALSVSDARAALELAAKSHPKAVPAIALGLFAGLRPAEALRVRPAHLRNGYVTLPPAITKTADARAVKIRPNLAAWLRLYPVPPGGVSERAVKDFRAAWKRSRKGRDWTHDVCRHSFATYAYEMGRDAAATAAEMGHVGTDIFFKHYRAMSAPGDGRKFFAIAPPKTPGKRP